MNSGYRPFTSRPTRRQFIKRTALAAGAATFGVPALLRGQNLNSKINIAAIGAAGKGATDTDCCATENIVALCDADQSRVTGQLKKYPQAKFYHDFREMFDQMEKSIDAVTVSTPDHFHAYAATAAMKLGKHVYCQKPLTQTVYEARQLRDLARTRQIITQMGNQGSAEDGLRRAVECIQSGLIGTVHEVHIWTDRPYWPQGIDRPAGQDTPPVDFNWDLWIGPAPMRPFKTDVYHPFKWRGWQDFGTGALGDMACHTVNMPFRALELGYPSEIEAQSAGINHETFPLSSTIRFKFPARGIFRQPSNQLVRLTSPVTLWWYDGGKPTTGRPDRPHDNSNKPPRDITADIEAVRGEVPRSGCLVIGDKGQIFSPDDYGTQFFVKLKDDEKFIFFQKHPAVTDIPESIPRNPFKGDADFRHHQEWIAAIKAGRPELCYSRFAITADLTEIMLLGCVSLRVGKKLEWDGQNMRATNAPEAAQYIRRANRKGWDV